MRPKDVPKRCTWDREKEEWRRNKCGSVILSHKQIVSLHISPNSGMPLCMHTNPVDVKQEILARIPMDRFEKSRGGCKYGSFLVSDEAGLLLDR